MQTSGFWRKLKPPFFILAPMSDVTDAVFRQIITDCGKPDVLYTEFVSVDGLCSTGRSRLLSVLKYDRSEHPIVAQFFGANPNHIYECAKLAVKLGFDGVDINMGCPDRKVIKQGAGGALIKTPKLARDIIRAAKQGTAGKIPISVKTRLGLSRVDEYKKWIPELLKEKPGALIIHGRTVREMSQVPAHWDVIGQVAVLCRKADVIVVGNGDVADVLQGRMLAGKYRLDGVMIGRGIFQNPWLFEKRPQLHVPRERLELLLKHVTLFEKTWKGHKNFDIMKKFFKVYVSGWDGAKELRAKLMTTKNATEVGRVIY